MQFINPWDNIQIKTLNHVEDIQSFDSRIHIVYVLFGEVTILCNNSERQLKLGKDDFYILSKTEKYTCDISHKSKVFYFTLDYFVKNTSNNYLYAFRGNSVSKSKATDRELIYQLKQLLLMRVTPDRQTDSKVYHQYFSLITLLEKYYQVKLRTHYQKNIRSQIEDLKFYIDNNFEKDIHLSDLANQLYVTEQYLSRIFKEQNGIGVSEYLIKRRLSKVRQLLLETEGAITDIAYSAGFSNINSFNRVFKKYQGMTPSAYRLEVKKKLKLNDHVTVDEESDYEGIEAYLKGENYNPDIKTIAVSSTKKHPFNVKKLMINLGYAGDLLQSSILKEFSTALRYSSFQYGRIWGLLSNVLLKQEGSYFDFSRIDDIIQNILDLDLKPFLDFGFKGKQIHESISKITGQELFQLPYQDMQSILERYRALVEHLITKFGYDEVSTWKIEIWKPNAFVLENTHQKQLAHITDGSQQLDITKSEDYYVFFGKIKQKIQEIIPELEVGGSGFSIDLEEDYRSFIEGWSRQIEKPNFLSLSIFPLDLLRYPTTNQGISSNSDFLGEKVIKIRQSLEEVNLCSKLVISEFNITISARDIINDSAFKGPFILKNIFSALDSCDLIGYWQLSDTSFLTFDVNQKEIFGGNGLLSKNGIPKPSFFAFDFLNDLGDDLLYHSEGVVVTQKQRKFQILLYHYCHLNSLYYYSDSAYFNRLNLVDMFENDGISKFNIVIESLKEGEKYKFRERRMSAEDGAFLTEANRLSLIDDFSREEINYLKMRCVPSLKRQVVTVKNNALEFIVDVLPHEMVLIEITQ